MSGLKSWEDDPAAQVDNLSQRIENMNIQASGRGRRGNEQAKATENSREPVTDASTNSSTWLSSGQSPQSLTEINEAKGEADTVTTEQAAYINEELLEETHGKENLNLIFIGHVDAGKSTLGGAILYATGMVDERTMEKLRRESKEAGESSF